MNVSSILRLESRTTRKNYENKSASFYCSLDSMHFLLGQKEVYLVHTCTETNEQRQMIISGTKLFNSLKVRKFKGRELVVYQYT